MQLSEILMSEISNWYVVKQADGHCEIVPIQSSQDGAVSEATDDPTQERWGPFASAQEAIARRVGLIRAGKCKPA